MYKIETQSKEYFSDIIFVQKIGLGGQNDQRLAKIGKKCPKITKLEENDTSWKVGGIRPPKIFLKLYIRLKPSLRNIFLA